ncbi:MAG: hypothetical protein HC853_17405 [Anaerolineae bacterium]|nr:hypothetical protein [Anaerolineae bacterium]
MAITPSKTKTAPRFALCIKNKDCDDLVIRKIYRVLPDAKAEKDHYLRVIDESGEDYLYPDVYFVMLELPEAAHRIFGATRRRATAAA